MINLTPGEFYLWSIVCVAGGFVIGYIVWEWNDQRKNEIKAMYNRKMAGKIKELTTPWLDIFR